MMHVSISVGLLAATCTLVGVVVGVLLAGFVMTGGRW